MFDDFGTGFAANHNANVDVDFLTVVFNGCLQASDLCDVGDHFDQLTAFVGAVDRVGRHVNGFGCGDIVTEVVQDDRHAVGVDPQNLLNRTAECPEFIRGIAEAGVELGRCEEFRYADRTVRGAGVGNHDSSGHIRQVAGFRQADGQASRHELGGFHTVPRRGGQDIALDTADSDAVVSESERIEALVQFRKGQEQRAVFSRYGVLVADGRDADALSHGLISRVFHCGRFGTAGHRSTLRREFEGGRLSVHTHAERIDEAQDRLTLHIGLSGRHGVNGSVGQVGVEQRFERAGIGRVRYEHAAVFGVDHHRAGHHAVGFLGCSLAGREVGSDDQLVIDQVQFSAAERVVDVDQLRRISDVTSVQRAQAPFGRGSFRHGNQLPDQAVGAELLSDTVDSQTLDHFRLNNAFENLFQRQVGCAAGALRHGELVGGQSGQDSRSAFGQRDDAAVDFDARGRGVVFDAQDILRTSVVVTDQASGADDALFHQFVD